MEFDLATSNAFSEFEYLKSNPILMLPWRIFQNFNITWAVNLANLSLEKKAKFNSNSNKYFLSVG